jgi:hypothetical protein
MLVEARKGSAKLSPGPETVMGHQRAWTISTFTLLHSSPKLQNNGEASIARVVSAPGVEVTGHGFELARPHDFPPGTVVSQILCCRLSRVEQQRDYDVPVIYGVLYDSGDLDKDADDGSEYSCRTVCTRIVCVSWVCVCRVGVRVHVRIDERCQKLQNNNITLA